MTEPTSDRVEDLLAEALERYDQGGDPAVDAFVASHPAEQTALRRGLQRCREMGMLGQATSARDFPERLGEFRLVRRLGGGGMGVVYEADQTSLGRRVALKVIRPELLFFEGARERFRREIEAVARLSHPAVVPVLASGEQDGVPWYAMELLAGKTLQEVTLALGGRDPARLDGHVLTSLLGTAQGDATDPFRGAWWETCVRAIHQVALGIRHAHLRGIVHRDIKPSNVMLTAHGHAVLLDFGIATITGRAEFTRTGNTPGSPAFMSPEQLRGDAVDERTDVYSLAATLWQLLALQPPFHGIDDLQKIRDGEQPSLRAKNREVPHELVLVLRKAMDRDRDRRYADMESFAADLQAVLLRKPISARRLGMGLRLLRWCQRHRVTATAAASLLLLAAMVPAVLAWDARSTNAALAAANALTNDALQNEKIAKAETDAALGRATAAKAEADGALIKATTAKAQADDSFTRTLDALDKVLVRLGNTKLRHVPQAEAVAIEALTDAVAMYRGLLPMWPDHVRLRKNAGRAFDSLAAAHDRLGHTEAAIAAWREGIEMLHEPDTDLPPEWVDGRAHLHMNLGALFANLRRKDKAAAEIAAAQRDFAAVADVPAFAASALRGRGELCVQRSMLLDPRRDTIEFEALAREALVLGRQLLALEPGDAEIMAGVARRMDNLGTFLAQQKRHAEAEPVLQEALELVRRIPEDARIWPPPRIVVSDVLQTLGNLQLDQHDDRALATLTEVVQAREACAADFQGNLWLRTELAGALHNLARVHARNGRDAEALPLLQRARELELSVVREQPDFGLAKDYLRTTLVLLNTTYNFLGRRKELVAGLQELEARDDSAGVLRTAARQWLRALELAEKEKPEDLPELREQYAKKALDLLLAAEKKGWGGGNRLDEPIYAPLEALPEFTALKDRLAAPKKAGTDK